jgi:hypothetical protein
MAQKHLVSMLQLVTTTGVSQTTTSALTASGVSREFYEFASADAAVFYIDCSVITGSGTPTVQFALQERDPATGVFFTASDAPSIALVNGVLTAPLRYVIDPCYAECYQLSWTVAGTTPSLTCSVVAELITRGR